MKRFIYYAFIGIALICGFCFGKYLFLKINTTPVASDNVIEDAPSGGILSNFFANNDIAAKEAEKGDLKAKYESAKGKARDTEGWIYVENSHIDYPVMLGDNNYYLNRTYDGKPSSAGSIFLDQTQTGFGNVSVIHGHNLFNGRMFSDLHKFYRKETTNQMKYAYIYDGEMGKERKFEVFSTIRVPVTFNIRLNIETIPAMQEYAKELKNMSVYKYPHELTDKPIIILNTCVSDGSKDHILVVLQEIENN